MIQELQDKMHATGVQSSEKKAAMQLKFEQAQKQLQDSAQLGQAIEDCEVNVLVIKAD